VGSKSKIGRNTTRPLGDGHPPYGLTLPGPDDLTRCRPEAFPSASRRLQDVPPKSTSLVSTVPAVRPGAVW
jgi:hypothetical protein